MFTGPAVGAGPLSNGFQGNHSRAAAAAGRGQPGRAVRTIPATGIRPQSAGGGKTTEVGLPTAEGGMQK